MKLYSYWRSTAAYRVRIALNLKGIDYEYIPVNLVKDGGEQHQADYRDKNPQGLVPLLECDEGRIQQSMAIIRYLEQKFPSPTLYSEDNYLSAQIEAMAHSICCDIHPLNNLRVMQYLKAEMGQTQDEVMVWYKHWLKQGFDAIEIALNQQQSEFALTDYPSLADICMVAQVYNARRFNFAMDEYPNIVKIERRCLEIRAFKQASPENQIDAQ